MRVACDRRNLPLLHLPAWVPRGPCALLLRNPAGSTFQAPPRGDVRVNTVLFGEPRPSTWGIPSAGDACQRVETVCMGFCDRQSREVSLAADGRARDSPIRTDRRRCGGAQK